MLYLPLRKEIFYLTATRSSPAEKKVFFTWWLHTLSSADRKKFFTRWPHVSSPHRGKKFCSTATYFVPAERKENFYSTATYFVFRGDVKFCAVVTMFYQQKKNKFYLTAPYFVFTEKSFFTQWPHASSLQLHFVIRGKGEKFLLYSYNTLSSAGRK